jgi:hypothetical protein
VSGFHRTRTSWQVSGAKQQPTARSRSLFFWRRGGHFGGRAIWTMSTIEALIFVAVIAVAVLALTLA